GDGRRGTERVAEEVVEEATLPRFLLRQHCEVVSLSNHSDDSGILFCFLSLLGKCGRGFAGCKQTLHHCRLSNPPCCTDSADPRGRSLFLATQEDPGFAPCSGNLRWSPTPIREIFS